MWNKPSRDGKDKYKTIHTQLRDQHLRLSNRYTKVTRFRNDEKSAKEVLTHFTEIAAKKEPQKELRLAEELQRVGTSLSAMRKTSAGKAILKRAKGPPYMIL